MAALDLTRRTIAVIPGTGNGPLETREKLLKSLASHLVDKIIVDVTNVHYLFGQSEWGRISSTLLNRDALGAPARWTTAFKATFAHFLREDLPDVNNPHTTFVAGDDPEAVATTIALVETIPGFKGANAGPLENSRIVELLGPQLVVLDKLNAGGKSFAYWKLGV
ncbi:unnamed protein product [Sphagnum tenellum]